MPYKIEDLAFRLQVRSQTEAALRLENNAGQYLGEEVVFECGRTSGNAEIIEDTALSELMEKLRAKLGS